MAKPNYSFEKRQKELAKKKKREEKLQNKRNKASEGEASQPIDSDNSPAGSTS